VFVIYGGCSDSQKWTLHRPHHQLLRGVYHFLGFDGGGGCGLQSGRGVDSLGAGGGKE